GAGRNVAARLVGRGGGRRDLGHGGRRAVRAAHCRAGLEPRCLRTVAGRHLAPAPAEGLKFPGDPWWLAESCVTLNGVVYEMSIEVLDGEYSASLWAEAHGDSLIQAAILHGATEWQLHHMRWGVILEFGFHDQ